MRKVKVFSARNDPVRIEDEVNRWLEKNDTVNVIGVHPSASGDDSVGFRYVITVFYEAGAQSQRVGHAAERKHERKDLFQVVDYTVDGRHYRDFIQDLSESGLFIQTSRAFASGSIITMTLSSPDEQELFKIKGKIVRTLPEGIGVEFQKESTVQEELIRGYIRKVSGRG
jgi:Tfp pilus assembly protein PilZ